MSTSVPFSSLSSLPVAKHPVSQRQAGVKGPFGLSPSVYTSQTCCLSFESPSIRSVCTQYQSVHVCMSVCLYVYLFAIDLPYIRACTRTDVCSPEHWPVNPRCCLWELRSAFRLHGPSDMAACEPVIHTATLTPLCAERIPWPHGHPENNVWIACHFRWWEFSIKTRIQQVQEHEKYKVRSGSQLIDMINMSFVFNVPPQFCFTWLVK